MRVQVSTMQSARPLPILAQMSPIPTQNPAPEPTASKKPHHPKKEWRIPRLLFECKDICHPGAVKYFRTTNTEELLREAVVGVLENLYTYDTAPVTQRSITLVLRAMNGVAYTTGSDLDNDHKEIHFSLDHISRIPDALVASEILGVVRHEMVHCWQYNGHNSCPGGLLEGIADWVRLQAGFCPPHWSRGGNKWDDGYQNTAYFLEWLEQRFGKGTVMRLNGCMKDKKYCKDMWLTLCGGLGVDELWEEYKKVYGIGVPKPEPEKPVTSCAVKVQAA